MDAITALEENLWSMWGQFGRGEGCRLVDEPRLLRFETPIAHAPYNSVMRTRLGADADHVIDATLAAYRARRVPLVWVVHPSAGPDDLDARLEARGLEQAEVIPGMVASLDRVPAGGPVPEGITVQEVGPTDRAMYIELLAWRYALPDDAVPTLQSIMAVNHFGEPRSANRAWIANRGREVLSKVTLHLDGTTAGIYGVATKPEARGLGLARLLTTRALEAARGEGADLGVLHSTAMAVRMYEGLGFERVDDFRLFAAPDSLHL